MLADYTFLTDHSYSLRPDTDGPDALTKNRRADKPKKHRGSSTRTKKTTPTSNRTVSIDRSSSDKENNSVVLSSPIDAPMLATDASVDRSKSSAPVRASKKKSVASRQRGRTPPGRKQAAKTSGLKLAQGRVVKSTKKLNNRDTTKSFNPYASSSNDAPLSLSIEERVKLRRTTPVSSSTAAKSETKKIVPAKKSQPRPTSSTSSRKSQPVQNDLKAIRQSLTTTTKTPAKSKTTKPIKPVVIQTKKLFLGSGLDLDNIVPGNRPRRAAQT